MFVTGVVAVILGGLVAAVTDPIDLYRGSWMAAYLVLIVGAAQVAMGAMGRIHVNQRERWGWTQFGCWNAGSAIVILGTLGGSPASVSAGSVLLTVALVFAATATRGLHIERRMWSRLCAYRVMLAIVAISIPVGIALSYLRHS